jgi:uncharacterized membrane protein
MDTGHGHTAAAPEQTYLPKHRVLALTDGVVAIVMTLLVLDVDVPGGLRGGRPCPTRSATCWATWGPSC